MQHDDGATASRVPQGRCVRQRSAAGPRRNADASIAEWDAANLNVAFRLALAIDASEQSGARARLSTSGCSDATKLARCEASGAAVDSGPWRTPVPTHHGQRSDDRGHLLTSVRTSFPWFCEAAPYGPLAHIDDTRQAKATGLKPKAAQTVAPHLQPAIRKMREVLRLTHALGMSVPLAGEATRTGKSGQGQSTAQEQGARTQRAGEPVRA